MNGKALVDRNTLIFLIAFLFLLLIIILSHRTTKTDEIGNSARTGVYPQTSSPSVSKTKSVIVNSTQTIIPIPVELIKSTQNGGSETGNEINMVNVSKTISINNEDINFLERTSDEALLPTNTNNSLTKPISREQVEYLANHEIKIGDKSLPIVIMTYDDGGPVKYIQHIMDVYEAFNFKATFFVTGIWAEKNRDLVKEMIDRGYEIGFHGWDHSEMTSLSEVEVRKQIADFLILFNQIDESYEIRFIRFPYGSRNQKVREIAAEFGLQSIMWTCGSGGKDVNTFNNIMRCLKNGCIVLSHSTRWYDVYQTEKILQAFVDLGYEAVAICDGLKASDNIQDMLTGAGNEIIE